MLNHSEWWWKLMKDDYNSHKCVELVRYHLSDDLTWIVLDKTALNWSLLLQHTGYYGAISMSLID